MNEFEVLLTMSREENIKNRERIRHNLKIRQVKNLLPYENKAFLALSKYMTKRISI